MLSRSWFAGFISFIESVSDGTYGTFHCTEAAMDADFAHMGFHGDAAVFPVGAVPGKGERVPACRGIYFRADGCGKGGKLFPVLRIWASGGILAHDGVLGHGSYRRHTEESWSSAKVSL